MINQVIRSESRAARREAVNIRNEPPLLTVEEERFNTVSHGVGAVLAVVGMVLLLIQSDSPAMTVGAWIYGVSMVLMMLMSSVYHAMPAGSRAKWICRRLDYTSIYLLIGGTFAPILLVYVGGSLGTGLLVLQWIVIGAGAAMLLVFGPGKWRWLHFTLYFLIGWSGLAFLPDFYRNARPLLWYILLGGVLYTVGMIPFARNRHNDHCVWHLFVLAAATLHWLGIYTQIYCLL